MNALPEFFIQDHSLRHPETISFDQMRDIYRAMKREGIASIRFDWDWDKMFPRPGTLDHMIVENYTKALRIMQEEKLGPPTIIISNPPAWATHLLVENKDEEYFKAYAQYANVTAEYLARLEKEGRLRD